MQHFKDKQTSIKINNLKLNLLLNFVENHLTEKKKEQSNNAEIVALILKHTFLKFNHDVGCFLQIIFIINLGIIKFKRKVHAYKKSFIILDHLSFIQEI